MSDETIEKTFQVTDPSRLSISNIRGSISITRGEPGVIEIKAIKHGNFDTGRYTIEMTQETDGSVHVETHASDSVLGFLSHPPRVDYLVHVPQGVHLEASGVSNSLEVSGLEGVFKLRTISGDCTLADLTGPLKINAVSGDVSGSKLTGTLELGTVSGNVRMLESSLPSAEASSVSGDLVLQTRLSDGPYHFSSVSGNVRLLVPADTHCSVELNSVSGSVKSSLPATTTSLGHGMKVTQVQNGGIPVRLKSVSGGVSLEVEGMPATSVKETNKENSFPFIPPIPPLPPVPPVPPIPPDPFPQPSRTPPAPLSTAEILQRIERGEMTVDEAIKLMKDQS